MFVGPKELNLEVLTEMTRVYANGEGRPQSIDREKQAAHAAEYFLTLLDGVHIDPKDRVERIIDPATPMDVIIYNALIGFYDYTQFGWNLLYNQDPNISDVMMQTIAEKLVMKIEYAHFTDRKSASRAIYILTNGEAESILSTQGTWYEDRHDPPRVKYDEELTNNEFIPQALEYAKQNIIFLK